MGLVFLLCNYLGSTSDLAPRTGPFGLHSANPLAWSDWPFAIESAISQRPRRPCAEFTEKD